MVQILGDLLALEVDRGDVVPFLEKAMREMRTDESTGAQGKNLHGSGFEFLIAAFVCCASGATLCGIDLLS